MKSNHLPAILILLFIIISVVLVTTAFQKTDAVSPNLAAAAFSAQSVTATPPAEDQTRAGTTDGIIIMGFVITAIVLFPVIIRRK